MIFDIIITAFVLFGILIVILDGMNQKIRPIHLIFRSIMIVLILLAWINPKFEWIGDENTVYFLIDGSYSQGDTRIKIEEDILKIMSNEDKDQKYEIIVFGSDAAINEKSKGILKNINLNETKIRPSATNYQKAVELVLDNLKENESGRIILMTDGFENEGDISETINKIKKKNIDVIWKKYISEKTADIQISGIDGADTVFQGQEYSNKINIQSNIQTEAILTIYLNNKLIKKKNIIIQTGNNVVELLIKGEQTGNQLIEAQIEAVEDLTIENNRYNKLVEVIGKPKIMLVNGDSIGLNKLKEIIDTKDIEVDVYNSNELPTNLTTLLQYNAVIFCDVSLENIDLKFISNLEIYLSDYGGGLWVNGGENSYALGGYYGSDFEKILPLNMERKQDGNMDDMGLVVIIDESGSMMGGEQSKSKLEMAKEASVKAVSSMMPKDQIGILAFSDQQKWVVPVGTIDNTNDIKRKISTIGGGGGTSIIPALEEAYKSLLKRDTKYKHIILVTDGQAEESGYTDLIRKLNDSKITLTTLGIGRDADNRLLKYLAVSANGRFYAVTNYMNIPKIFTKETSLVSKKYLNNRDFYPIIENYTPILKSISSSMPLLEGYVSTSPKNRSTVLLSSDKDEPILAYWQYGLGKVYCWTSDIDGHWNINYLETKEGARFYLDILGDLLKNIDGKSNFEIQQMGNQQIVKLFKEESNENLIFKIFDSNGKEKSFSSQKIAGGEEIEFQSYEPEVYTILGQGEKTSVKKSFVTNYSKEYKFDTEDSLNLEDWIRRVNGIQIKSIDELYKRPMPKTSIVYETWMWFLIIFLPIFLVDIFLRKFKKNKIKKSNIQESSIKDRVNRDNEKLKLNENQFDLEKLIKNKNKKV